MVNHHSMNHLMRSLTLTLLNVNLTLIFYHLTLLSRAIFNTGVHPMPLKEDHREPNNTDLLSLLVDVI